MANGVVVMVGVSALVFAIVAIGVASHIYADAGLRMFFWPRLQNGYEVQHATRIAAFPWYLALYLAALNGLAILLFSQDITGQPTGGWAFWLLAALVPVVMAHLVDYRRSRGGAVLSLLLVAGTFAGLAYDQQSWVPLAVAIPFVLWTLNGVRAAFADRVLG
jgi:hypothetical protein